MSMACTYCVATSPCRLDARRPVHDARVGDAAPVDLALPALERRVARPRPAARVVVEVFGPPSSSIARQDLLDGLRHAVEELRLVQRCRSARPRRSRRCRRSTMISVLSSSPISSRKSSSRPMWWSVCDEEAGEHLHHPRVQPLLVGATGVPLGNSGSCAGAPCPAARSPSPSGARRPARGRRPSPCRTARVLLDPLLRRVVRRVRGARCRSTGRTACPARPASRR